MARRNDHMLEALRASVDQENRRRSMAAVPQRTQPQGESPGTEGDWIKPAAGPLPATATRTKRPESRLSLTGVTFVVLFLACVGGAFALGWLLAGGQLGSAQDASRSTSEGDTVEATILRPGGGIPDLSPPAVAPGRATPEAAAAAAPRQGAPTAAPAVSPAELALRDPAHRFTLQVVQYNSQSERNRQYAGQAFEALEAAGLPVVGPLEVGGRLVLVVGAGARVADLQGLKAQVEAVLDPRSGRSMFRDPYEVRIDSVVRR